MLKPPCVNYLTLTVFFSSEDVEYVVGNYFSLSSSSYISKLL